MAKGLFIITAICKDICETSKKKKKKNRHFTLPDPGAVYLLHSEALKLVRNVCQRLYKRKCWVVFVLVSTELLLPFLAVILFVPSFAGTVYALSTRCQCLQVPLKSLQ